MIHTNYNLETTVVLLPDYLEDRWQIFADLMIDFLSQ